MRHNQVSFLESSDDLNQISTASTAPDVSSFEDGPGGPNKNQSLLIDHLQGRLRYSQRPARVRRSQTNSSEHSHLQPALGIGNLTADLCGARLGIEKIADVGDSAME